MRDDRPRPGDRPLPGDRPPPGEAARSSVLRRTVEPPSLADRLRGRVKRAAMEAVQWGWEGVVELGAIGPDSRRGRRFGAFGEGSVICFPPTTLFNERYIHIGSHTMIGPDVALSAGMVPGQHCVTDPVVRIGDRCLIGRGSGIVGHLSIVIGDDVWTGHHVYVTDQNHGYEDIDLPISKQVMPERPVEVGDGSWLGHGTIVLPGARIGRHVVVGAGSVVTGELPDFSIAAGVPARVVKRYRPDEGWVSP
jgi:acetyltransferase-like isoleucine patch superfamily enzyme